MERHQIAAMVPKREFDRLARWIKVHGPAFMSRCELEWVGEALLCVYLVGEDLLPDDVGWCRGYATAFLSRHKLTHALTRN